MNWWTAHTVLCYAAGIMGYTTMGIFVLGYLRIKHPREDELTGWASVVWPLTFVILLVIAVLALGHNRGERLAEWMERRERRREERQERCQRKEPILCDVCRDELKQGEYR